MHRRDIWIILPIALNLFWLLASLVAGSRSFPHDSFARISIASLTSGVALASIVGFVVNDIGPKKAFVALCCQTSVLVTIYATIYLHGMADEVNSFGGGLYYSIVTWTARGHILSVPTGDMLFVTAMESITGYVFLALLISILASAVGKTR